MVSPELLRSIRRIEDLPGLAEALGYRRVWRELPAGSLGAPGAAAVIAHRGDFRWYGLAAHDGAAGRAARLLAARGIPAAVMGLDPAGRRVAIAAGNTPALELSLDAPDRLGLARLERAAVLPDETPLATVFRIAEALQGKGVDQRFFAGFRRVVADVIQALPARIPRADRHALSLLLLTRILFLYFVEAKGWLAGRPRFLREEVDRCLGARRSLHRDLLEPLFFGTLNRPAGERSALARRYGAIPFLNGGLFEPHPLERRYRPGFPTPLIRDAFDTLFEKFHFTLAAPSGESIAPDMLGRVFEGVMAPDERHATGSYYTPAGLVDAVLRDGIASWLSVRLGVPWRDALAQLDAPGPEARNALRRIRLLDPAAGSGAFLLGSLRLIAGPAAGSRGPSAARLRRVLSENLYGVDRNAAAVRLAELRLWLEVVAADPAERPGDVTPLPNLDALVRQGDSLFDAGAALPMSPPSPARATELRTLRTRVVGATGPEKAAALAALRRAELSCARASLEDAVTVLGAKIADLMEAARSRSLFGERRGLSAEEGATLRALRAERHRARERLRTLRRSDEVPWFDYGTQFGDVLARGGFDLVAGNPPWVRAEALAPETRKYLAERYRWFRGARSRTSGYAHHPDLAVAFLERALGLTARNGVVAFLLPAKLATTGYSATARAALARSATIAVAADLRDDPRAVFDATVYPMALVAVNAAPRDGHRVRVQLCREHHTVLQQDLGGGPWLLDPGPVGPIRARLQRQYPRLDEFFTCHLGVKTGLNRAFLDPPADVEPELLRWAARGRDLAPFRVRRVRKLLWPCDSAGAPLEALPPEAERHLARHFADLRRRADHSGGKPWRLFRTGPAVAPHRVIWADVARRLEAAPLGPRSGHDVVPLNSCYVMPVPDAVTALRVAAWLNSTWCRVLARAVAEPASGGFARFNARVVSSLPLPRHALDSDTLLELGRAGAGGVSIQDSLDDCCAGLLALTAAERNALAGLGSASAEPRC